MDVAASQCLCFISSPQFLMCRVFKTAFMDKEEKEMTMMMMLMINQHNDRCKRVRKWILGHLYISPAH